MKLDQPQQCIFCGRLPPTIELSREHVFPEAIGGRLYIYRVCKDCNSGPLAEADATLSNHFLVEMRRLMLGVSGKSRALPNPFGEGVLADDEDQAVRITPIATGPGTAPTIIPRREILQDPSGAIVERMHLDAADAGRIRTIIERFRARNKLPTLSDSEMDDYIVKNVNSQKVENPTVKFEKKIDIREYKRTLLKIVYELAWYWLGDLWLNDAIAHAIRRAVLEGFNDAGEFPEPIRGLCDIGDPPENQNLFQELSQSADEHVGFVVEFQNIHLAGVRILNFAYALVPVSLEAQMYGFPKRGLFIATGPSSAEPRFGEIA